MKKYFEEAIKQFDEKVICECCGKQIRRGEATCGFADIVCIECARNGYKDGDKRKKKR